MVSIMTTRFPVSCLDQTVAYFGLLDFGIHRRYTNTKNKTGQIISRAISSALFTGTLIELVFWAMSSDLNIGEFFGVLIGGFYLILTLIGMKFKKPALMQPILVVFLFIRYALILGAGLSICTLVLHAFTVVFKPKSYYSPHGLAEGMIVVSVTFLVSAFILELIILVVNITKISMLEKNATTHIIIIPGLNIDQEMIETI